jgi:hypothetical protein
VQFDCTWVMLKHLSLSEIKSEHTDGVVRRELASGECARRPPAVPGILIAALFCQQRNRAMRSLVKAGGGGDRNVERHRCEARRGRATAGGRSRPRSCRDRTVGEACGSRRGATRPAFGTMRDPVERALGLVPDPLDCKAALPKTRQGRPRRTGQPAGCFDQGIQRRATVLRQHLDDERLLRSGTRCSACEIRMGALCVAALARNRQISLIWLVDANRIAASTVMTRLMAVCFASLLLCQSHRGQHG